MSLLVTISGETQITYNDQAVLTATVTDSETEQTPSGLQYHWTASDGSFSGPINEASATYHANLAQNTNQAVTISCEVTLPGNPNPTVSAPTLDSLTELGITGQLVNMLIDVEKNGTDLLDRIDPTAIASGSDTDLASDISINRIRWDSTTNRLRLGRSSTGSLLAFWDAAARSAYSAYIIINDGTVVELPGAWIGSDSLSIGSAFVQWEVPSSETTIINALNSVASGQTLLLGIADTGSIGIPDEIATATATINVQRDEPPRVEITASTRINPSQSTQLNAAVTDPEGTAVTVLWQATDGTIDNPTALNPIFTASDQSGPVTITCTATDANGIEGSSTHVIVINSPPVVNIIVPDQLEVGHDGDISAVISDPNSDTVTVEWAITRGSIDDPTVINPSITAPDSPGIVGIICIATDSEGLETRETAQITVIPNQPPWVTITTPPSLDTGEIGNLQAVVSDPTNDAVTVRWAATDGIIDNPTALNTTFTAPNRAGSVKIICTAIDEHGETTRARATIAVHQLNRPPIIELNVPSSVEPGQTVSVVAAVDDPDSNNVKGEWNATAGSFAQVENSSTTFTAPPEPGVVPITYEATDDMGATAEVTTYVTVGNPNANIFTPAVRIEIEGVDVTDRWIRRDGLTVGKSIDQPELPTSPSSGIAFNIDNEDGDFDHSNPDNFFVTHGRPAHGRGAQVLIRLGLSKNELTPVFAGEISEIDTNLQNTKALIKIHDLNVRSQQKSIENFGIEITRRITDFEGAAIDYTPENPVFYFPTWGLPISRNSVSLTVHQGDNDIDISVVEAVATEGMLSNRNAEIDYAKGLIRFEAPPDDGAETQITATWKRDYRYKRPDFLVRQLLKNTGIQDTLGIADDTTARFAIDQTIVRHSTDPAFTSHGRPYFEREGITRWMKHNPATDTWLFSIDTRLVEYDEYQDEYTELATIPEDDTIQGAPTSGYGTPLPDRNITLTLASPTNHRIAGVAFNGTDIIALTRTTTSGSTQTYIRQFAADGTEQTHRRITVPTSNGLQGNLPFLAATDLDVHNNKAYVLVVYYTSAGLTNRDNEVHVYNLSTNQLESRNQILGSVLGPIAVTSERIYVCNSQVVYSGRGILVYDHQFNYLQSENLTNAYATEGIALNANYIFGYRHYDDIVRAYQYDGTEITSLQFTVEDLDHITIHGDTLYFVVNDTLIAYSLSLGLNYHGFVGYQFDTDDFDSIYIATTNTFRGDALADAEFSQNRIYKHTQSSNSWANILNPDKGQPQLGMPYDFISENRIIADNRKNFKVITYDNKTLIFYRRTRDAESGISMFNETNDVITDVYTESQTGVGNNGLPYSMDFWTDERSDGIYVYTFVVKYTFSGSNFSSATLKVFRRRVEPLGTQSEIFSETFTSTSGDDLYPVSVSDLILAPDRSKWYFTLDYQSEANAPGKAELCELPKDGGTRVVRKTYDNPLLGPRSPAKVGNRYFYLEGGWVRLPKSDTSDDALPDDEKHYPNEGGHLIEIESNGDITDHGIVWRSQSKLDSPNPAPEDAQYDGWGLHNAITSNMASDSRGNLRFIAGHGLPYRINNNLPTAEITGAIPDESNFTWLQWGQDLSTKIASFPTNERKGAELIQQLAQIMNWEIGSGPAMGKVEAIQAADSAITDWSANANFFLRPRTVLPAKLRTAIPAGENPTTIDLNDPGLPAEASEFPVPPTGERYAVIIDKEMFTYTDVTPDSQGRALTGVVRAQNRSTAAAHSIDAAAYFVDHFASGEIGTSLVSVENRSIDFANLRNDVNVPFGDATYNTKHQQDIDENGEFTFNLQSTLLDKHDKAWAQIAGDTYLNELRKLKETLEFTLVFSPTLQPGQLVVIHQSDRLQIDFKLFRLLQVQHHIPHWQTQVTALEIIPEGVPPRWLTVPRQLLKFNQNLNLDLKEYLAGTQPMQIQASGLPSGFSINNGVITGAFNTMGEHTITLTATNSEGEATATVEILVGEPRWPSIPAQTGTEGQFFVFDYTNYLPEGLTPITYALGTDTPAWLFITRTFIYGRVPDEASDQTYTIPIEATNVVGSATVNVTLNVENTN